MRTIISILFKQVVFLTAALSFNHCFAQHQPYFISSTETDGLSDEHVTCFYKDRNGYVWIGTENGLNRFDGLYYKIYRPSAIKKNNLSNAYITSVSEDSNGNTWVGTRRGINRIDAVTDTTEFILSPPGKETNALPGDLVWDICPGKDGSIWIAVDSKELVHYQPATKKVKLYDFKRFLKDNGIEYTPVYHSIFRILNKSADELWLATTEGIVSFNKNTGTFKMLYGTGLDKITFFQYDAGNGKLYCTDERNTLIILDAVSGKITTVSTALRLHRDKTFPPYRFPAGALFVPSPEGLVLVSKRDDVLAMLPYTAGQNGPVSFEKMTSVYRDRDDISWIGTPKGACRFVPQLNANLQVQFDKKLTHNDELASRVFHFLGQRKQWLVADHLNNRVWLVNDSTGNKTEYERPPAFKNDTCFYFYPHGADSIFFIGRGNVIVHGVSGGSWEKVTFPQPWTNSIVACLTVDGAGNYWMGTMGKGLLRYNRQNNIISRPPPEEFGAHLVYALQYDSKRNRIWIGTHHTGIYYYDIATATYKKAERNDWDDGELYSSLINDIITDGNDNVWWATLEGGIAKYRDKNNLPVISHYGSHNEMPDNNVYSIAANSSADIYFTTGKGIGWIKPGGKLQAFFNKENGLPYSKFNQAISVAEDYKIATLADNNLFCFDPAALAVNSKNNIALNLMVLNDSVAITSTENLVFASDQNTVSFSYALPEFIAPAAVQYYYRLEGFDDKWIDNGKQRMVRFSSLAPGDYTFKVKAKRANGQWIELARGLSFTINPPFWKTWWFVSGMAALFITAVLLILRKREQLVKKNAGEKSRVQQQIAELEIKALRSQMNPHFVFNSLNSISMLVAGRQNDRGLEYLSKFSKFLRIVLDGSENNFISLADELKLLNLYLEIESLRFGDSFSYSINTDPSIDEEETLIPSFIIQPLAENAIWHGLLHKTGERRLMISISKAGDSMLRFIIKDNGIGIEEAASLKAQRLNGSIQKPKGLQMLKDRLLLLDKQFGTTASLTIEDLKEGSDFVSGTKVTIELPVKYD